MAKNDFDSVWLKILGNQGKTFFTKRHLDFKYNVNENILYHNRTDYGISKSDFKKAYSLMPLDGPGLISNKVRGSSYVWAILNDKRINTL